VFSVGPGRCLLWAVATVGKLVCRSDQGRGRWSILQYVTNAVQSGRCDLLSAGVVVSQGGLVEDE